MLVRAHVERGAAAADLARGRLTTAARRYGFHATPKAPFRLMEGCSVEELAGASHVRGDLASKPIGPLEIDLLGSIFALVPTSPLPTLLGFVSHLVEEFERFRGP